MAVATVAAAARDGVAGAGGSAPTREAGAPRPLRPHRTAAAAHEGPVGTCWPRRAAISTAASAAAAAAMAVFKPLRAVGNTVVGAP